MSDVPYNPNDPAFLASRALDEDLSADEQRRLADAQAASGELRTTIAQFAGVDRLLKRWADRQVELDWETHARLIHARTTTNIADEESQSIDNLLSRWGQSAPRIDDERYTAAVMDRVRSDRHQQSPRNLIFRIGAPLAAAAALVIVVSGLFWLKAARRPVSRVVIRSPVQAAEHAESVAARAVPVFDRTPVQRDKKERDDSGIVLLAMGSSPLGTGENQGAPPL